MTDDYRLGPCPSCGWTRVIPTAPPHVCLPCQDVDTQPAHRNTPTDIRLTRAARMERM